MSGEGKLDVSIDRPFLDDDEIGIVICFRNGVHGRIKSNRDGYTTKMNKKSIRRSIGGTIFACSLLF